MRDAYSFAEQSDPGENRQFQRAWSEPRERTAADLHKLADARLLAGDGDLADELAWLASLSDGALQAGNGR